MSYLTAEIIPEEPDADNAAVGRIYTRFAVWFFLTCMEYFSVFEDISSHGIICSVPERIQND